MSKRKNADRMAESLKTRSTLPHTDASGLQSMPELNLERAETLGFSIRIDGHKRELLLNFASSSVMYFVLSFLTQIQITRLS